MFLRPFLVVRSAHTHRTGQMPELRNFYKHLYEKGWKVSGYGDNKDERDLLERFHFVIDVFLDLKPAYAVPPIDLFCRFRSLFCSFFPAKANPSCEQVSEGDRGCHSQDG